jgi:hypothetical protein
VVPWRTRRATIGFADGRVKYTMKKPWRDGTWALVFEPLGACRIPVIVLGARKTWKGPPPDPTVGSSSVTLGAGRVDLVHSF